ncbi:uncharacterized protein LOC114937644 isoform X2 [Nylanderia fulva]|uniref:uncharacterized protein LOC114937644 isoform X2 n=1 Tax=Nylanderia fulva TaxID=613905 RepID=UPI0010FBB925|nr:uncharacterized protein LOC114937644 isoform X2 [Nylanderia fulva]
MDTLQEYIFSILNFRANITPCSPQDIKWICIEHVLQTKYGQDIIVYTIFHSVARRLGLRCDVLRVSNQFCVFWKPKYVTNNLENTRCFYIKDYPNNYPNCLHDSLPYYKRIETHRDVTKIGTEKMLV